MTTVINEKIENLRSMGPPVKDDPNLNEASMGEAYWWYATNRDESALARRQEIIIKHGVACQYLLYCIDSFSRMEDVRLKSLLIVAETSSEVPEKDTNEHVRPRTTRRNKAHWNLLETDQLQQELFSRIKKRCYETPKFSSVELSLYSMTSDRNELISKIMWDDGAKLIDEDCRIHGMSGGERARWNDRRVRAVDYSNGENENAYCYQIVSLCQRSIRMALLLSLNSQNYLRLFWDLYRFLYYRMVSCRHQQGESYCLDLLPASDMLGPPESLARFRFGCQRDRAIQPAQQEPDPSYIVYGRKPYLINPIHGY